MSLETIQIFRDFPVINGFVQVPPNFEKDKTLIDAIGAENDIAGSQLTRLSLGSGKPTGSKFGRQFWLRLPPITPGDCCPRLTPDPAATLLT